MKERAPRNKTLTLTEEERNSLRPRLLSDHQLKRNTNLINRTIHGDVLSLLSQFPAQMADLIIVDPPYNLSKNFNGFQFKATTESQYLEYLRSWFPQLCKLLKSNGSLYLCGDWKSTSALQQVMEENLTVMNRITWQREKGRGASRNWKNGMEDIWYGVIDKDNYYFDLESVKQKRRVLAPYREKGVPKDWEEEAEGKFRLTCPSNFWDDITVPYWSMPENTDHPTQKPEKLVAKLILASCPPDGLVFDPFLGSGTTSVVAKKLGRKYLGVEMNEEYCLWAEKRLMLADENPRIQGYENGMFKERNMH
ncbi:MAG: site-specific DNA-methyltransferase [Bacteroidales bacterium]|jgi:site-specific DNA-methyltransferase (adenine-specific)|nr:site-specific DNA-methyltransferase [Bacteroidales bacterium]